MRAPLAGVRSVWSAPFPAAEVAATLLGLLGAGPRAPLPDTGLELGSVRDGALFAAGLGGVSAAPSTADEDWQATGLDESGRHLAAAPARHGHPATAARAATMAMAIISPRLAGVDGAALLNRGRSAVSDDVAVSVNGTARLIRAADTWVAMNLPRPEDLEMVPALVGRDVPPDRPWAAIAAAAADGTAEELVARADMLGLAAARLAEGAAAQSPWSIRCEQQGVARPDAAPLVVNLGSLWAAPLAAHLLRLSGCRVVEVEGTGRPDMSRQTSPDWYDALHAGHQICALDLTSTAGRRQLHDLLGTADVVITGSRRRALARLGATPGHFAGLEQVWLNIVGHRHAPDRAGFGDDAAVCGGLTTVTAGRVGFLGDAIADPLTGMFGALAALSCLHAGGRWIADLGLCESSAFARTCVPDTPTG